MRARERARARAHASGVLACACASVASTSLFSPHNSRQPAARQWRQQQRWRQPRPCPPPPARSRGRAQPCWSRRQTVRGSSPVSVWEGRMSALSAVATGKRSQCYLHAAWRVGRAWKGPAGRGGPFRERRCVRMRRRKKETNGMPPTPWRWPPRSSARACVRHSSFFLSLSPWRRTCASVRRGREIENTRQKTTVGKKSAHSLSLLLTRPHSSRRPRPSPTPPRPPPPR